MNYRGKTSVAVIAGLVIGLIVLSGCPEPAPPSTVSPDATFYIGPEACSACHADKASTHVRTGHAQALKAVTGAPPTYPAGPGVPDPPAGFDWSQISYLIGGYEKAARFVDANGFVLTTGTTGAATLYNLPILQTGVAAGFVPYLPQQTDPLPFGFTEIARRTTGAVSSDDNGGMHQGSRPGVEGTWFRDGVQCEACHGPGSRHPSNPLGGTINPDPNAQACMKCHSNSPASSTSKTAGAVLQALTNTISASGGLINAFQQVNELEASPHTGFNCNYCHNPHVSVWYDRSSAIRNECQACHFDQNMARHEGFVFVRGDYTEQVTCVSCHMPFAVETTSTTDIQLTNGNTAHFGDTRSHVFRLDPSPNSQAAMFSADGTQVSIDSQGRASVSTCYVCQRCHTGQGNAFAFPANEGCAFGSGIHGH